ncbi:hypothetical protein [Acidovorax sp. Root219]|uniref:hypothetical protein n=1 Tax=Acidovorax sp. Root219 TaxID=1736493 RepID=UPI00070F4DB9|nr:hypothetical protein [Acidovorax sp. Root219]KRC19399.1 hypothetical protein ASE28_29440 [Acidovorax sp. Root219]
METRQKIILSLSVITFLALTLAIYFASNAMGYYRFTQICAQRAGLQVDRPLAVHAGWSAEPDEAGILLASYPQIDFVRYADAAGQLWDLKRTTEKANMWDAGFRPFPADLSKAAQYRFKRILQNVPNEVRLTLHAAAVTEERLGQVVVTYQDFGYRVFAPDWGPGQATVCSSRGQQGAPMAQDLRERAAITTAFASP